MNAAQRVVQRKMELPLWTVVVALATVAAGPALAAWVAIQVADGNTGECVRGKQLADAARTQALAGPTDRERRAETALLTPGGDRAEELGALLAARAALDEARRRYPAPPPTGC